MCVIPQFESRKPAFSFNYRCQLIDRLPFSLESLAASKLGKVIKNLGKGERSAGELYTFPFLFPFTGERTLPTALLPYVTPARCDEPQPILFINKTLPLN